MVGEIRDRETAEIALHASLTGHMVLSTLHTNDATSAITRLTDIGVKPFLLSASLRAVLAQRLVRKVCPHCRRPDVPPAAARELLGLPPDARGRARHLCAGRAARLARARGIADGWAFSNFWCSMMKSHN